MHNKLTNPDAADAIEQLHRALSANVPQGVSYRVATEAGSRMSLALSILTGDRKIEAATITIGPNNPDDKESRE